MQLRILMHTNVHPLSYLLALKLNICAMILTIKNKLLTSEVIATDPVWNRINL